MATPPKQIGSMSRRIKIDKLYLMLSPEEMWKVKVGVSNYVGKRKTQVGKKTVFLAFVPLPSSDAYLVETACHNVLSPLNTPVSDKGGSGGREWFWIFNILTYFMYSCLNWDLDLRMAWIVLIPYPIDILIIAILAWALVSLRDLIKIVVILLFFYLFIRFFN